MRLCSNSTFPTLHVLPQAILSRNHIKNQRQKSLPGKQPQQCTDQRLKVASLITVKFGYHVRIVVAFSTLSNEIVFEGIRRKKVLKSRESISDLWEIFIMSSNKGPFMEKI